MELRSKLDRINRLEIQSLYARIAALESQLAAANEAVRVLGEKHKLLVAEVDASREVDVAHRSTDPNDNPHRLTNALNLLQSCRAATDAAKAREGA